MAHPSGPSVGQTLDGDLQQLQQSTRTPYSSTRATLLQPLLLSTLALSLFTPTNASSSSHHPISSSLHSIRSILDSFNLLGSPLYAPSFAATSSNVTYSSSVSTLLNGRLDSTAVPLPIAQTSDGGIIYDMCLLGASATSNGTLIVGGDFSQFGGVQLDNVARINLDSDTVSVLPLENGGLDGVVRTLFCDTIENIVWIGGSFNGPSTSSLGSSTANYGGRVVTYDPTANSFAPPPFVGFNTGSVLSITNTSTSSVLFTGSFQVAYSTLNPTTNTSGQTGFSSTGLPLSNITLYSPGSTPFSASLTPIPILGSTTDITASPTTTLTGYIDPDVMFCPTDQDGQGQSWFGGDSQISVVNVALGSNRVVAASGLRIGNTFQDGRGTSAFRIVTLPDNAVQTVTYLDLETDTMLNCTTTCPLSTNSSIPFQDFIFTAGQVEITGFQLVLLEWTGSGPGLHLIELLSSGSYATTLPTNTTSCASIPSTANSEIVGNWTSIQVANTALGGTTSEAISASVLPTTLSYLTEFPSITYYPYVTSTGNYTISLVVPGCRVVGDCSTRTSLDVLFTPYSGAGSYLQTVPPSSNDQAYPIYTGSVQASSDSFNPAIKISLSSIPSGVNGDRYTIVASQLIFELLTVDTVGDGSGSVHHVNGSGLVGPTNVTSSNTGLGQNPSSRSVGFGVFEWTKAQADAANVSIDATGTIYNSSETPFDQLSVSISNTLGFIDSTTTITTATLVDSVYYVGGTFSTSDYSNIIAFPITNGTSSAATDSSVIQALAEEGLNGPVYALVSSGTNLFVGGSFTATKSGETSLSNLALYDTSTRKWSSIRSGLDGPVTKLSFGQDGQKLLIGGTFSNILASPSGSLRKKRAANAPVGGFSLWDFDTNNWAADQPGVSGNVNSFSTVAGSSEMYFGGGITGVASSTPIVVSKSRHHLARGVVVVICMAIALGVVFLGVLLGVVIRLWRRHHEDESFYPVGPTTISSEKEKMPFEGSPAMTNTQGNSALLSHINAATEGMILASRSKNVGVDSGRSAGTGPVPGAGAVAAGVGAAGLTVAASRRGGESSESAEVSPGQTSDSGVDEFDRGPSSIRLGAPIRTEPEFESGEGTGEDWEEGEGEMVEARVAHARWSLIPDTDADRELRLSAGKPYLILNDSDPEWWLALDPTTGEQGAVPASWML
ncbi:Src homology-3 domain [Phaffia rhodozyma]|uniref:Src homology-3 domain n=1 Tax=Phaffia rhodozyma TaxID=264483 RepID=A0A0F7SLH4_PHARH|nr:Src homology-3 domain [Phaffia rhodozyma]